MTLVEKNGNNALCDSSMVAKKFNLKHNKVIAVCDQLMSDLDKIKGSSYNPLIIKEDRIYRGNDYTAYLMDRDFFSMLSMRFRSKEALEWQIKFIEAFKDMELKISESEKPSATMIELNELTKVIESNKEVASVCGKQLANYKKVKKQDAELWAEKVKDAQYTLGFEV